MALATFSRPGLKANGGTDNNELFLKKFAGEVLTTFETNAVFKPLHTIRTIENGKSASFPTAGTASTRYMAPGDNLLTDTNAGFSGGSSYLSAIGAGEKIITIDNLLTSSTFIAKIEEAKNHYDVRSIYTEEIGRALAKKFDKTIAQVIVNASRASADAPAKAGSGSQGIGVTPDGSSIAQGLFKCAVKLDNADVPDDGERYCVITPELYALLVQAVGGTDKPNAVGSYSKNNLVEIAGIKILKSNNLPSGLINSAEANSLVNYGSATTFGAVPTGMVFHRSSVGTVKLLDLAVESEYKIELQGTFIVSKYAMGHGILRPECAVELTRTAV